MALFPAYLSGTAERQGMSGRGVNSPTLVGLMLVLVLWLVVECAGPQEDKGAGLIAGSFVGETSNPDVFVAIVVGDAEQGADTREVRAYLCDSRTINEWFTGAVSGNDFDLTSESGSAELEGNLGSEAAIGTITLNDGRSLYFEASPTSGIAGLYSVSLSAEAEAYGTSDTGARLEGEVGQQGANGRFPITGTITPPDRPPEDFGASAGPRSIEAGSECRVIVLADGRIRGVRKGAPSSGFIDQESWF
jgi:hypothetical protein